MSSLNIDNTVAEWVLDHPRRSRVFERFGIDFCCGGSKKLGEACRDQGLEPYDVVAALHEVDEQPATDEHERNWSDVPMAALCDHIESTHHAYLRGELPRLRSMTQRVAQVHGERHPETVQLERIFVGFMAELGQHMLKEEQVLFPIVRELEGARQPARFHCGSVANPIRVMEHEHEQAGAALKQMRALTRGFSPPEDACDTFRALLDGLAHLEADMHQHVHEENNILFPRALQRAHELEGARR